MVSSISTSFRILHDIHTKLYYISGEYFMWVTFLWASTQSVIVYKCPIATFGVLKVKLKAI